MQALRCATTLFALALVSVLGTGISHAQATRTWVSGVGDDANPCSRTAPCKTFAGAISKTAAAGEINCLDSGGFGAVTITKSITIDCTGVLAGVLVSGTNGIIVTDSGANSIAVTLRNLDINGLGTGLNGISFLSGRSLRIEHVTIYGFQAGSASGISMTAGSGARLSVNDVTITDCANGVFANPISGNNISDIKNVRIWNITNGISAQGAAIMSVRESNISMSTVGVLESGVVGGQVTVSVSQFTSNGTAVKANVGSYVAAFGNVFFQNGTVFNTNGGAIYTDAKNVLAGNGIAGAPNATVTIL
jgi:hypothetical protein